MRIAKALLLTLSLLIFTNGADAQEAEFRRSPYAAYTSLGLIYKFPIRSSGGRLPRLQVSANGEYVQIGRTVYYLDSFKKIKGRKDVPLDCREQDLRLFSYYPGYVKESAGQTIFQPLPGLKSSKMPKPIVGRGQLLGVFSSTAWFLNGQQLIEVKQNKTSTLQALPLPPSADIQAEFIREKQLKYVDKSHTKLVVVWLRPPYTSDKMGFTRPITTKGECEIIDIPPLKKAKDWRLNSPVERTYSLFTKKRLILGSTKFKTKKQWDLRPAVEFIHVFCDSAIIGSRDLQKPIWIYQGRFGEPRFYKASKRLPTKRYFTTKILFEFSLRELELFEQRGNFMLTKRVGSDKVYLWRTL